MAGAYLARSWRPGEAQGAARSGRELQRRHPEAGERRRGEGMIVRAGDVIPSSGGIVGAWELRRPGGSVKSGQLPFCERKQSFTDERREREMIHNEIY
jgi:hypothetical protein